MRLRNIPGVEEKLLEYPTFVPSPADYRGRWREYFQNDHPIHLEIGSGKGRFLTTLSARHADTNFIALERQAEVLYRTAQRTEQRAIPNLALVLFDAARLPELFAPGEVDRIYLNFSDPWPKKRHAKRRLTHPAFLRMYRQVLKPGGAVHLKTDNEGLFEFSLNQFADEGWRLRNITFDLHRSAWAEENVMTEYEERFSRLGQRIYRLEAIHVPQADGEPT